MTCIDCDGDAENEDHGSLQTDDLDDEEIEAVSDTEVLKIVKESSWRALHKKAVCMADQNE